MDATVLLVMDVHRVLTEKVFPRQAEVSTVARVGGATGHALTPRQAEIFAVAHWAERPASP
jgi:hypothetical protein